MREMNFSQRLRRFIVRKTFSAPYRVQFYEALRFLLENKQPLKTALEQMRDARTDFGRKWHPFAELATDCIESLRENSGENSLEYTLSLWVPQEEAAVISAGIRSGSIVDALQFATTLTDAKEQIHQAIWQMAIYPVGLLIMMTGTLYVLNTQLIPELSKISSPIHGVVLLVFFMDYLFLSIITALYVPFFCSDHRFNIMVSAKLEKP